MVDEEQHHRAPEHRQREQQRAGADQRGEGERGRLEQPHSRCASCDHGRADAARSYHQRGEDKQERHQEGIDRLAIPTAGAAVGQVRHHHHAAAEQPAPEGQRRRPRVGDPLGAQLQWDDGDGDAQQERDDDEEREADPQERRHLVDGVSGQEGPVRVDPLGHHQGADHEHGNGQGERDPDEHPTDPRVISRQQPGGPACGHDRSRGGCGRSGADAFHLLRSRVGDRHWLSLADRPGGALTQAGSDVPGDITHRLRPARKSSSVTIRTAPGRRSPWRRTGSSHR